MKYINKKITFILWSSLFSFFLFVMTVGYTCPRYYKELKNSFVCDIYDGLDILDYLPETFWVCTLAFTVALMPILLTLPLKPAVFDAWKRYAIWSIPVILILVAWIETVGEGGGLPGQFHPGYLFYPIFFFIHFTISLIIIIRVWLKTRRV